MSAARAEVARAVGSVMRGQQGGSMPHGARIDAILKQLDETIGAGDIEATVALFTEISTLQMQALGLLVPIAAGALGVLAELTHRDPVSTLDQVLTQVVPGD